jgi:hypothetical protein
MNTFAQACTAIAAGLMAGFLGVGALANGIDAIESQRCPGLTRTRVNRGTILKDWASWGQCPLGGISSLKP